MATHGEPQLRTFLAPDGKELAYVVYPPADGSPQQAAFLYLHGIESHAGWFRDAAERLQQAGHFVYCLDRRGSGLNRENRDHPSGHLPAGVDLLDDLHAWVQHLRILHAVGVLDGLAHERHIFDHLPDAIAHARSHVTRDHDRAA